MENINAYFVSKITFIRYLLVILISTSSLGVLAEDQNPQIINGSWVSSGGRDYQSLQNPRYTFEVSQSGIFDIRLENKSDNCNADPYLFLLDANGREKGSNDDWGTTQVPQSPHSNCNYNSRIKDIALAKGTYTLVAGTYNNGESGDFVISARGSSGSFDLRRSDSEEKSISSECSGQWKSSGGQSYKTNQNPNFDLIVKEKGRVTINLTSSVDTFLYLLNKDSLGVIEKNDDIGNGDYNSRISMELNQGTYVLVAATYRRNQEADFELTAISTKDKFQLNCSSKDEGGNSTQEPLSLGEDVTITWSPEPSNRFYQRIATGGHSTTVAYESSNLREFPVTQLTGQVTYQHPGTTVITAVQRVNGTQHTAEYRLTVEKANQAPLVIEDITKTFAPGLEIKPDVSGGSTDASVTFEFISGNTDVVSLNDDGIKIEGAGTVGIRATKASNENYNSVSTDFNLTVNKAQPWIEIEGITNDKFIKNGTSGEIDIEVKFGIGQGENKKNIDTDAIEFTYANSTQNIFEAVQINGSKIVAKRMGMFTLKVNVEGGENYHAVEKQFVLEVRPNEVKFDEKNLSHNSITKQCGESVDVDLMIDNKTIAETEIQNTGSQDILVFASSDTSVAQVNSQNGEVDLVGTGTATISAKLFGDSDLADSYNLTVNKGEQPIEFQEKDILKIDGDEIFNNSIKNPIKGAQPDGSITYSIKQQDGTLLSIDNSTGEVSLDSGSELPATYSATIEAKKRGNNCYQEAIASYTIDLYNTVVKFPKPGETADKEYKIEFSSSGSASGNNIKLYYTNTPADRFDEKSHVVEISPGIGQEIDISQGFYTWNTSGLPEGNYYIIARTDGGINASNEDCDLQGAKGCFIAENPLIIEHDHGLAMDCSAMFNYPGGHLKAPYQCNKETLALRGPSGRVSFIGKQNNLKSEHHEENVFRVYPSQSNFLTVKQDGRNSFYYDGYRIAEGNFTQNMTISSRDNAFIGVDKDNNIALNYPNTSKTYSWLDDFNQYKALSSYADSKKEDLINNGSIANLIYQLPQESSDSDDMVFESVSDFAEGDLFTSVVTNGFAKAALTKEGRIKVWGLSTAGGVIFSGEGEHANSKVSYIDNIPDLNQIDYVEIYPGSVGFSAIKKDNSIIYWGLGEFADPMNMDGSFMHVKSKVGDNINKVFVNNFFYGITSDGSVKVWNESSSEGLELETKIESISNIKNIYTAGLAITLEDKKGDLYWISTLSNYENPELQQVEHSGFTKIYSNEKAFAGIT